MVYQTGPSIFTKRTLLNGDLPGQVGSTPKKKHGDSAIWNGDLTRRNTWDSPRNTWGFGDPQKTNESMWVKQCHPNHPWLGMVIYNTTYKEMVMTGGCLTLLFYPHTIFLVLAFPPKKSYRWFDTILPYMHRGFFHHGSTLLSIVNPSFFVQLLSLIQDVNPASKEQHTFFGRSKPSLWVSQQCT